MNTTISKPLSSLNLEPQQVMKIFDLMPDFIYILNLEEQTLHYTNNRLYDVLGYTWDDIVAMNYTLGSTMIHEDLRGFAKDLTQKFENLMEDDSLEFEMFFKHKNQSIRELRNRATVLTRHKDGRNKLILVIAEDISESKKYEKIVAEKIMMLQRQKEQMETAEAINGYGSWISEENQATFTYSEGLFKLLQMSADEYPNGQVEKDFYQNLILESERQNVLESYHEAISNRSEDFYTEHQLVDCKGVLKYVALKAKCFYDDDGNVVRSMGVVADRSEIEAYQVELELRMEALKKSNQELEQFAYVASHDLQEPLRKIVSFGERLTAKYASVLNQEGNFYVDRMINASHRMQTLIQDLLTYSRATIKPDSYENVDLNEIMKQVLSDLELKINEKKATITIEPLPAIEAQSIQMYQIFQNLFTNALKFNKVDINPIVSVKCTVATPTQVRENLLLVPSTKYYKFDVSDNGIGIEKEYSEKIFTLFQRLHGRSEYDGTGLGLAICRKIVEGHKGQIIARGTLDLGTTFTIFLPEKQNAKT